MGRRASTRYRVLLFGALLALTSLASLAASATAFGADAPGRGRWTGQNPLPVGNDLGDVACTSEAVCYVTGLPGALMVTGDGGSSWSRRSVGIPGVTGAIRCPSASVCFLSASPNLILHSTDGARSWSQQTSPIAAPFPMSASIGPFSCPSSTACYAIVLTGSAHPGPGYIIATSNGGSTWVNQTPGGIGNLAGIDCPDTITCYAAGQSGEIVATTDGTTWTHQAAPPSDNFDLAQVSCIGHTSCAIAAAGGKVLTTRDGGANWVAHDTPVSLSGYLTGMSCTGLSVCMATGMDNSRTPNMIAVRSADGGSNWTTVYPPTIPGWLVAVACPSALTCVAAGNHGWILVTHDGGAHWSTPSSGPSTPLHAVSCPTDSACYAAGDAGTVLATTNAGHTWTAQDAGTTASLAGISCVDTSNCTAVGTGGTVTRTSDAGLHWSSLDSGTTADLLAVGCPSATHCVAVSDSLIVLIDDTAVAGVPSSSRLRAVSCPSALTCYATGASSGVNGVIQVSGDGGHSWTAQNSTDPADLEAISCVRGGQFCAAVDNQGNIVSSNDGQAWSVHPVTSGWGHSVSCPVSGGCLALFADNLIATTGNGGISSQVATSTAGHSLAAASCPSVSACTVVGDSGTILRGTTRTIPARVVSAPLPPHPPVNQPPVARAGGRSVGLATGMLQSQTLVRPPPQAPTEPAAVMTDAIAPRRAIGVLLHRVS